MDEPPVTVPSQLTMTKEIVLATIRKRNDKWQAQIRLAGMRPISATHSTKSKALAWAVTEETRLLKGEERSHTDRVKELRGMTFGNLLRLWDGSGGLTETNRTGFNEFLKDPISDTQLTEITKQRVAQWKQQWLTRLKPDSLKRYARVARGAWEYGTETLELPLRANPFCKLGLKLVGFRRLRRLRAGEYDKLLTVASEEMKLIVAWAVETGMRRGEIANARAEHLSEDGVFLNIPETKTSTPRCIPLTQKAQEIARKQMLSGSRLFTYSSHGISRRFLGMVRRAKLEDLHFHDLRHEALSRFNAVGLSVFDIKTISGHKRVECLDVYIQPELDRIAKLIGGDINVS